MRSFAIGFSLALAATITGAVYAQTVANPTVPMLPEQLAANVSRPCLHAAGGWTTIDCSAGAAYSAALNTWSRYVMQADAGDTRIAWHTASSGADADGNDGFLPSGSWYEFITGGTVYYITCDGSLDGGAGKIRYLECQ